MRPDVQVESVTKTPLAGIYEVFAGSEISCANENVNDMIVRGRLGNVARKNATRMWRGRGAPNRVTHASATVFGTILNDF